MKKTLLLPLVLISLSRLLNAQCVGALDLPTTTDYVQFTNPFYSYTNEITVEGWVYMDGSINSTPWIGQATAGVDNMGTNVWHWHGASANGLSWQVNDNGTWRGINSTTMTNGWHHVATVADNVSIRIYIDGVLNVTGAAITGAIVTNSNSAIHVGHDVRFPAGAGGRNGDYKIGEFRVWNVARTPSEISTNMSSCLTGAETGLKLYNKFENGIGSSATSAVGPNGTLVNMNTTTSWVIGSGSECCTPAAALNFDGVNDHIDIGSVIPSGSSYTKEMWVYAVSNGCNNLLSSGDDPFYLSGGSLAAGNGGNYNYVQDPTSFPLNTWTHASVTYDAPTTTMKLYVNGILVASGSSANAYSGAPTIHIGRHPFGGCFFDGSIDDVRIWNVARTQCEINAYMNCEIPTNASGLLANYHFNQGIDEGSNPTENILMDLSGNGHNSNLLNFNLAGSSSNWVAPGGVTTGSTTPSSCTLAAALNFDGVDDFVSIPSTTALSMTSSITIETWVKTNGLPTGEQYICTKSNDSYFMGLNVNGNVGRASFYLNNVSPGWLYSNSNTINDDNWHHIAATYDGVVMKLYIDGVLDNSAILSGSFTTGPNNVDIGSRTGSNFLQGTLDEFRIWNVARTQCQINTYMSSEIPSSLSGLIANYHFNQGVIPNSNSTVTMLNDASGNFNNGALNNFALNGSTSNWVAPGGVISGYTTTLAPPVISVSSGAICAGQSFTMVPSGAMTFTFSNGSAIVTPTADATYSVSGTDVNGCASNVDAISSVTVNALPVISVNSGSICAGQSFTMVPNGADSYTYSNGSDIVMPTADATYTVTGTNTLTTCNATIESTVTVNALPTLTVNSGTICTGQSFTLVPSGGDSYTYSSGSDVVNPTIDATYTVTGTNTLTTCSAIVESTITVNALPTISVNSGAICAGQSFTMIPTGADSYTYSSGSDVVNPTVDATYTVTGTNTLTACAATIESTVTVNALPTIMAMTSNTLLCAGETATLSVSGATSYTWSNNENTTDIVVTPTMAITYTVDGTDANGCVNSTTILQDVNACTGIVSLNGNTTSINVYPNPNNGIFIIDLNTTSQVSITNALGQVILTETMSAGKQNLNIQNQSAGIYFVKVIQQDKQHIIKLIKK